MKIKVIKRKVESSIISPLKEHNSTFEGSNEFLENCKKYEYSTVQMRSFLSQQYIKVFPDRSYPEGKPMELIRLAIAYELVAREYEASGKKMNEKLVQNHKAAINFCPEDFDSILKGTIEAKLKQQGENENMKTKKAVLIKKAPKASPEAKAKANVAAKALASGRMTAGKRYLEIFDSISKGKKMSDDQIAETISKEFPTKKHDVTTVAQYRQYYNRGQIAGQKSKPKTPIAAPGLKAKVAGSKAKD